MSKRITLADFEIEQIVSGLTRLRNEPGLNYEVTKVGQRWYDRLIVKLKDQHPRSVETLGVSGHGDVDSVAPPESKEKI
jgi:hypothetical protein